MSASHRRSPPFTTDPFAVSDALTLPCGRVGGETFITFSPPADVFALQGSAFEAIGPLSFFNGVIADVPPAGTNVVVLRTFDNDGDATTPFGAGNAANLIADQITTSGAGLFVYFNSGLNLPRLVYSTNLSDNTADLKGGGLSASWTASFGLTLQATASRRIGRNPNPTSTGADQDGSLTMNRFWLQASMPF